MDRLKRYLLPLALALAAFVAFEWFTGGGESEPVADVATAIASGAQVVDVRTAREYQAGHVAGALHADLLSGDLEARVAGLDRREPVYLYCASGHRSGRASAILEGLGFERVVNAGGIGELAEAGVEIER